MVRTLRKFPLDTNLTKWLSKYEGSLQKGKEKKQLYGDDDVHCGKYKHEMK